MREAEKPSPCDASKKVVSDKPTANSCSGQPHHWEIVGVPTDAKRIKRSSSAPLQKTAFTACRAMKTTTVTLRMMHDAILTALL
jgi:hypothetical protein